MEKKRIEVSTVASDFFLEIKTKHSESSAVERVHRRPKGLEKIFFGHFILRSLYTYRKKKILKYVEPRWQNMVTEPERCSIHQSGGLRS